MPHDKWQGLITRGLLSLLMLGDTFSYSEGIKALRDNCDGTRFHVSFGLLESRGYVSNHRTGLGKIVAYFVTQKGKDFLRDAD